LEKEPTATANRSMSEIGIREQVNGKGQDRMGQEMRLAELDWF
jgi:hypothetical protein